MSIALRGGLFVGSVLALLMASMPSLRAGEGRALDSATVVGNLQQALGCSGDWQPECTSTALQFDVEDGVWQGAFDVPAGAWEYKLALNGSWDENYGAGATRNGPNIALPLSAPQRVKFYYDDVSHWITDNAAAPIVVAPGNFQRLLGCSNDWDPSCLRAWLQDIDGVGRYSRTTWLPAGSYEVKVALDESWDVNYGAGGERNGANIAFTVPAADAHGGSTVVFEFDAATKRLTVVLDGGIEPEPPQPSMVTIAGTLQAALGCPGNWQPECTHTALAFDAEDGVWHARFDLPAGQWEYKAALDGGWDENYGANATRNGPNIPLQLDAPTSVTFYYSHRTHWVTDSHGSAIAVAAGNFQRLLGCDNDWDPSCLRSWLQDADGDGIGAFSARLPAGDYEVKVALRESWDENYGAGGERNGANIPFSVPDGGAAGTEVFFHHDRSTQVLSVSLAGIRGDLRRARAHWLDARTIAWDPASTPAGATLRLHADAAASLRLTPQGVAGGSAVELVERAGGLSAEQRARFPHLRELRAFELPALDLATIAALLKGQLAVSAVDAGGAPLDASGMQIPGVLDDVFFHDGTLGPQVDAGGVSLSVWAPTAQSVQLLLFDTPRGGEAVQVPMSEGADGVWRVHGPRTWLGRHYLFEVSVYAPSTGRIEINRVTDPYSLALSADSHRSLIVDLAAPATRPPGWSALAKPPLAAPEDSVLYELHVRDFSISDASVPAAHRGTFRAFTHAGSTGMRHLRRLADAGLTHVHLLPVSDFATVPERLADRREPAGDLAAHAPDSDAQQAAIAAVRDEDGFNWGYDPLHYTVPEGSYATDPDGITRIVEFRDMVAALNRAGLRVIVDVVYNHTSAAGQNARAVLDRIVPGYYHRLNHEGAIEMSSCCPNTASEHRMMEKLMIDSVLTWARDYKVDGFRFDLMGHHMKSNMLALRDALDALTIERDGVDGRAILLYGEGWNFGEVANNARGENAVQRNMAGTGIGTFNDRLRDGVRGGSPFSGIRDQGFATGLHHDPNGTDQGDARARLLQLSDWVRIGLAGTLAAFEFEDMHGRIVRADQVDYFGQPAGYTADPQEDISYAEKHDNETLLDAIQLKSPAGMPLSERIRMHWMGTSLVALGQGIPFFHAGQEILRSKSLDRDSYNAGDWFNVLDFSLQQHGWGRGLPSAEKNAHHWPLMAPLLADPALAPDAAQMAATRANFETLLRIRSGSRLFRLRTAEEVQRHLRFHNTGPAQRPGLIVKSLEDADGDIDRRHRRIVTLFNAGNDAVDFVMPAVAEHGPPQLHPLLRGADDLRVRAARFDEAASAFHVPARTTAMFIVKRAPARRIELLIDDVQRLRGDGRLGRGHANSLESKLQNALRQLQAGQARSAANMLGAFVNEARAIAAPAGLAQEAEEVRGEIDGG